MTPTPHGQVPEALIDLIDAYAETRHRCGGIYNARTEAARNAVIEALSGVQAQSAPVTQQAGYAEVIECGNSYAKVKLKGEAFGSARVGDIFYTALQQDEPVGEVVSAQLRDRNPRAWPKVSGVSRDEGHSRALLVFFAAEPTDDEVRAVHDTLAAAPTAKAAPVKTCVCGEPQASGTVHRVDGPCYVAATQQEAQEPCPTCAALARTVMCDQVSFDRKPDCYGIRQITDDEGVEEWEDIRTSPDVAREEANDMMATGRGEIYEVVPLWETPQPAPATQQAGEARPVTPYTCPKCHALWLHWPAEQTGFGRDTLNCRSADHCHYCEKAGVEQLQRLERIPAALHAPQPSPTPQADSQPAPIDMVLHCPKCGLQHIDAPEKVDRRLAAIDPPAAWAMDPWTNEPHRSHLCHGCGHIWRPADVPTNGVAAVKTTGKADSPIAARAPADSGAAPATDSYVQPVPDKCDRIVWRGNYYHLPPTAQAADSVPEDAARLDWLALAGPTSICVVINRTHDGEVEVSTDDVTGYGKTLREALDAARKQRGAA